MTKWICGLMILLAATVAQAEIQWTTSQATYSVDAQTGAITWHEADYEFEVSELADEGITVLVDIEKFTGTQFVFADDELSQSEVEAFGGEAYYTSCGPVAVPAEVSDGLALRLRVTVWIDGAVCPSETYFRPLTPVEVEMP